MKKMRGVIEPYTLGFLIMLIGGLTTYLTHDEDSKKASLQNRDKCLWSCRKAGHLCNQFLVNRDFMK